MSLIRPTELPRWGTDQTNETEPGSGQKDSGWTFEQIPPSSFQNWLDRVTYDWISWINERLDDDIDGSGNYEEGVALVDPLTKDLTGTRGVTKIRILPPKDGAVATGPDSVTNNIGAGNQIQATGALFQTNSVEKVMLVELVGTNANDGFYLVASIVDEDNITVRRLDGSNVVFAAEASILGTVQVWAREDIQGQLIAPGGWGLRQRVGGNQIRLQAPSDTFGSDVDWIFPSSLPSTKSVLTIDENGQVSAGDPSAIVTIGDGISSFGDFEGTDQTPFVSALAALPASGGIIQVGVGTYIFTATLDISGDDVQLQGVGRENALIEGSLASSAVVLVSGSGNSLQGVLVRQTQGDSENFALQITGDKARVSDCRFEHTYTGLTPVNGYKAVQIKNADNVLFAFNEVMITEADSDVDRIGVHVLCESTGADEEMYHARILHNNFIVDSVGSPVLGHNSVVRLHGRGSATGHGKLYKCQVQGNIEEAAVGSENAMIGIGLYGENDAGGAAGDRGHVRGCVVQGNITNRGVTLTHNRQNGSAENPEVEENTITGNMVTTSVVGQAVVETTLNGATVPVDIKNSLELAGNFVAATSGGLVTVAIDDSSFNKRGDLQTS